jgi:hypothetical protein
MRSVRRPDEWHDLLDRAKADREKRVLDGQSAMADRSQILLPDRQSAELAAAARRGNPAAVNELPLEFIAGRLRRGADLPPGKDARSDPDVFPWRWLGGG